MELDLGHEVETRRVKAVPRTSSLMGRTGTCWARDEHESPFEVRARLRSDSNREPSSVSKERSGRYFRKMAVMGCEGSPTPNLLNL